jgi:hypothetical protein
MLKELDKGLRLAFRWLDNHKGTLTVQLAKTLKKATGFFKLTINCISQIIEEPCLIILGRARVCTGL